MSEIISAVYDKIKETGIEEGILSVSYTHLDVYKRQGVSFRIFYGEAFCKTEETNDAFDYDTFLDEFFNSYVWMDFNFAEMCIRDRL